MTKMMLWRNNVEYDYLQHSPGSVVPEPKVSPAVKSTKRRKNSCAVEEEASEFDC